MRKALSVSWSVHQSVHPSLCPSIRLSCISQKNKKTDKIQVNTRKFRICTITGQVGLVFLKFVKKPNVRVSLTNKKLLSPRCGNLTSDYDCF